MNGEGTVHINEAKRILEKLQYDLKRLGQNQDEFEHNYADAEERFQHLILKRIAVKADDIFREFEYLNKPVLAEGVLSLREDGRYEIAGTNYYFTSGTTIEIWDNEDEQYYKTQIEHKDGVYYAVIMGTGVKLEGLKARIR